MNPNKQTATRTKRHSLSFSQQRDITGSETHRFEGNEKAEREDKKQH